MATNGSWSTPDLVPTIVYSDVPRAVEWLTRVFGFRERSESRLSWPGGVLAWLEVGDSLFSVTTPDDVSLAVPYPRPSGTLLKVYVDDVDRHFEHARGEDAVIVGELQDGFWGGRTYRVLDHEENLWEVAQRGRDLPSRLWTLPPGVSRGAPE